MLLSLATAAGATVTPTPGMVITSNTTFTPGTYYFGTGQGITIAASNITVDGNGAVIVGPGAPGNVNSYIGIGVSASGFSGDTLKNLTASGFQVGLQVSNGSNWTITNNNFSNNYNYPTDPNFGDDQLYGAIKLLSVTNSQITQNTGDNTWNGLYLQKSNGNTIANNHFSPCGNTCLQLSASSNNSVNNNMMSYGYRNPNNESSALDSACLLMETGSNKNTFSGNDFTHGGDGVFIRSLNNVVSTGNTFINNDASYAFNNAWECWSPGNTFNGNKGNHSSYGFWLGGSQHTVFVNNEAAYNGVDYDNNPEQFGVAGVAVVKGPSSHFVCKNNNIHDNHGAGIAIGNRNGLKAFHWILQQNTITNNSGYGIYLYGLDWIDIAGNVMSGNGQGDLFTDTDVADVFQRTAASTDSAPTAAIVSTATVIRAGTGVTVSAAGSTDPNNLPLSYRWDLGDGTTSSAATISKIYRNPGFYRVGVTVNNGKLADLKWLDLYVVDNSAEYGTEGQAASWTFNDSFESPSVAFTNDTGTKLVGTESTRLDTTAGFPFNWSYPASMNAAWNLSNTATLDFWLKLYNGNSAGWQSGTSDPLGGGASFPVTNPLVVLYTDPSDYYVYTPSVDLLENPAYPEALVGWQYMTVPLTGSGNWVRSTVGSPSLANINYVAFATDTWNFGYTIWIDGLSFATPAPAAPTGLAAAAGTGQVSLTWTASAWATSYKVYRGMSSGSETLLVSGVKSTGYTDLSVTDGTTYYYKVAAVNSTGTSALSTEASATPVSGPVTVTDPLNDWSIAATHTANWTFDTTLPSTFNGDPSRAIRTVDDAEAITYAFPNISAFSLVVFTKNAAPSQVNVLTSTNNGASYGATGVNVGPWTPTANGWGYYTMTNPTPLPAGVTNLEVQFLPGSGSAGDPELGSVTLTYTPSGPALPGSPLGLTATAGNGQVALAWNSVSNATSYNVYRATSSGAETLLAAGITSTSYANTGLTNGTTYYYTVAAVNSLGTSPQSSEVSATPTATTSTSGPVSIDCGGPAANPFVADTDFTGGTTGSTTVAIATPFVSTPIPPQTVLQTWRTGTSFTYTLGGFPPGTAHGVQLYFMEPTATAIGQRTFDVSINGSPVLANFDIYAAANGQFNAIQENFNATADPNGQIAIAFTSGSAGQPICGGITIPN